jgi:hypothetical protein
MNFNHGAQEAAATAATVVGTMTETPATGIDTDNNQLKAASEAVAAEMLMAMMTAMTTTAATLTATMVTHGSVGGSGGYNANGSGSDRYGRGKIQQSCK